MDQVIKQLVVFKLNVEIINVQNDGLIGVHSDKNFDSYTQKDKKNMNESFRFYKDCVILDRVLELRNRSALAVNC